MVIWKWRNKYID